MSVTVTLTTTTTFNPVSSFYTLQHTLFPISTNFPVVYNSPLRYNGTKLLGFLPRATTSQDQVGDDDNMLYSYCSSRFNISNRNAFSSLPPTTQNYLLLLHCAGVLDSELHSVLQLATGSELYEVERILFGTSYFSPLLKSIAKPSNIDYVMIEEDPEEREEFISILESRFFYLAADARSSLRGWRPTYRSVLLGVRKELKIPCSTKLSTEDLEVEIFLHLLQEYSSEGLGSLKRASDSHGSLEVGLSSWKLQAFAALGRGAEEFYATILKGGGMLTLGRLYNLISRKLSGKVFLEAANYQIKKEVLKEGGRLAAINLESRAALLAAKQGLAGAASRYLGVRSIMALLGPMLWGTFLADVVIQMLGTDYARILRAIYAFAQIRISRTYRFPSDGS